MLEERILIPNKRVGALIGKNGQTKAELEKKTQTKLDVTSQTGEAVVRGNEKNPIGFYNALDIVKAIGRGFSAEHAFLLVKENVVLEIIDIKEELNATEKELIQKKGRIIGTNGKVRTEIEKKTNCFISVYGKTVAIIGEAEDAALAKKAIEMLLQGASHVRVYGFLNKQHKYQVFEI